MMRLIRIHSTRLLLGALAGAAFAATAMAASFELPPLVAPATAEHHSGKVVWADLVTPDLDGAKQFYSGLFGWTFRDLHTGHVEYALALLDGQPVGGLVHRPVPAGERRQPAWLTFISVRDIGQAEKEALSQGGKVVSKLRDYPQRGRQEILADPQGAVFAVLESASGDPADVLAGPGGWIWSSLITSDPNRGSAFYQTLFGYEVFDLHAADGREHFLLASDGYARASANSLPEKSGKAGSHWLNFVRVDNAKDAAAKAVALGGRVLVEPHADRHGGMIAVVADPSGAAVGLMEWSETESKEVGK